VPNCTGTDEPPEVKKKRAKQGPAGQRNPTKGSYPTNHVAHSSDSAPFLSPAPLLGGRSRVCLVCDIACLIKILASNIP
jgi:hypothetical protein